MTEFFDAIKNPLTKDRYEKRLDLFFRHIGTKGSTISERAKDFASRAKKDPQWTTYIINEYMRYQRGRAERGEIEESTVSNYYKPIKLFCVMNDIILNWEKISKRIPQGRSYANDRAPTREEIVKILSYPDRRIKPAILTMLSSGIRVEAWNYLNLGDIEKIERDNDVIAASITIYKGTKDQYRSFITPEAYYAIEEYVKYRKSHGERITGSSPVMRDLFHPDRGGRGEPHLPKRLKASGVKRLVEDALKATGIRKPLPKDKRRHEFQANHGFRKFFTTVCERHMKSLDATILEGHDTGIKENYNRPSMEDLLDEYLKAVPELTMLQEAESVSERDLEKKIMELLETKSKLLEERVKQLEKVVDHLTGKDRKATKGGMTLERPD